MKTVPALVPAVTSVLALLLGTGVIPNITRHARRKRLASWLNDDLQIRQRLEHNPAMQEFFDENITDVAIRLIALERRMIRGYSRAIGGWYWFMVISGGAWLIFAQTHLVGHWYRWVYAYYAFVDTVWFVGFVNTFGAAMLIWLGIKGPKELKWKAGAFMEMPTLTTTFRAGEK